MHVESRDRRWGRGQVCIIKTRGGKSGRVTGWFLKYETWGGRGGWILKVS